MRLYAKLLGIAIGAVTATVLSSDSRGSSDLNAQSPEIPKPAFSLTLFISPHHYYTGSGTELTVRLTNIAKSWIVGDSCAIYPGYYRFVVTFNGVLIEETAEQRSRRKSLQNGQCAFGPGPVHRSLNPGEFQDYDQDYETAKPGTYQIAAEEETFPDHPEEGLTIRSNTITIVVPEPSEGKASRTVLGSGAKPN